MLFTQTQYKNRLATLEAQIITMGGKPTPDKRDAKLEIFGMAQDKALAIAERAPKGKLLETLAAAHLAEEKQREGKPAASATLIRPAASAVSAQSLAAALIDEQERRAAAAKIKTREQFTAMSPKEQSAFCRNGGKITV